MGTLTLQATLLQVCNSRFPCPAYSNRPSLGWRVIERGVISNYSNRLPSYLSTGSSMSLRYRFIRPEDWLTGVNLVLQHPSLVRRTPGNGGHYRRAWSCCRGADTFTGKIFEESKNGPVEAIGLGIFVLVTDEFMHQAKRPPLLLVWS